MKKLFTLISCCISLGITSLAYAENSTLTVINNASDTTLEITNDTMCSASSQGIYLDSSSTRWSSALAENPIPLSPKNNNGESIPTVITWKNCTIIPQDMFKDNNDHSKMLLTINDLKSGESATYKFHIVKARTPIIKHLHFAGRKYNILLTHTGDFYPRSVKYTETTLTINSV